jgi:hypothetical protein
MFASTRCEAAVSAAGASRPFSKKESIRVYAPRSSSRTSAAAAYRMKWKRNLNGRKVEKKGKQIETFAVERMFMSEGRRVVWNGIE